MKKSLKLYLLVLLLIFPSIVYSMELANYEPEEAIKYEDAIKAVKETMKSYYIRGPYIQYNNSKAQYPALEAENATSQDAMYTVCGSFSYTVNNHAFGMDEDSDTTTAAYPSSNLTITSSAAKFYEENISKQKNNDGKFLIYFQQKQVKDSTGTITQEYARYIYGDTNDDSNTGDYETLINQLQPGDLLTYTGHALLVYDVIRDDTGKIVDALIINSTQSPYVLSKIDGTQRISFNYKKGITNEFINTPNEGTIQLIKFSDISSFVTKSGDTKTLNCTKSQCSIIRTFYKNEDGNTTFNYTINPTKYNKAKLKTEYPGIYIERTTNVGDNTAINIGDELTYTLKIKNKSNVSKTQNTSGNYVSDATTYQDIVIQEWIIGIEESGVFNSKGEFVGDPTTSATSTETKITCKKQTSGNKEVLRCGIDKLDAGEEVTITYKVKVDEDYSLINNKIITKGVLYRNGEATTTLSTGINENPIQMKVEVPKSYSTCYKTASTSGATGLNLIDDVYECAYGTNMNLGIANFNFTNFVSTGTNDETDYKNKAFVKLKDSTYKDIILNKSFNSLVNDTSNIFYLPRWTSRSSDRIRTLYDNHFKEGDILIYSVKDNFYYDSSNNKIEVTDENGIYAFIYIDGKFQGKNGSGTTARDTFTYDYYTDKKKLYQEDITELSTSEADALLKFLNYQSLYTKDNYVILRPEQTIKQLEKISVDTSNIKTNYIQNYEALDLDNIDLDVTYNDGEQYAIPLSNSQVTVSGFDNSEIGANTINVSYQGKTTTFDVNIVSKQANSISVSKKPTKLNYIQNYETLDLTGGELTVTYSDNSTDKISLTNENITVTGFDNSELGKNTLTIKYLGFSTTLDINIIAKAINGIAITKNPLKLNYIQNYETLDLTGGELTITYDDTSKSKTSLTNENITITGFDNSKLGTNTISIEYFGFQTTLEINIIQKSATTIELTKKPLKLNYIQNYEELDLTGGEITISYNDKSTGKISLTNSDVKVTGFDNSVIGTNTLTVEYSSLTTTFTVEIITKQIVKIELTTLPEKKIYYQDKDKIDLTGGVLTITYNDTTTDIIDVTTADVNVLKFDNQVLGTQNVVLEYQGHTTTFEIEVKEDDNPNTGAFINMSITLIILIISIIGYAYFKKYRKISKL